MAAARAAIFGCEGEALSRDERAFFADADPWGFILFARNVADPTQLRRLTDDLRAAVGRPAPVLIDQEGGRVARMRGPHWRLWEDAGRLAALPEEAAAEALRLRYRLIAAELSAAGVDVNCAPLLDVAQPGAHRIIADRALGSEPGRVARLGRAVREGLADGGVAAVVKHMPGHGRATVDSHEGLPSVSVPLAALDAVDFAPFRAHADAPMGMTAHVVFEAIDPENPGTLSAPVTRAIRERIGFDGLLITDDLSMGALSGPVGVRAARAFAAGVDVALHCNGDRAEMAGVAAATPRLAGRALERAAAALVRPEARPVDAEAAAARYAALTAPLAGAHA